MTASVINIVDVQILSFLVALLMLFCFVSQKYINKSSCTVKQISDRYIQAITIAVCTAVVLQIELTSSIIISEKTVGR